MYQRFIRGLDDDDGILLYRWVVSVVTFAESESGIDETAFHLQRYSIDQNTPQTRQMRKGTPLTFEFTHHKPGLQMTLSETAGSKPRF